MPASIGYSTDNVTTLKNIDISDKPLGYTRLVISKYSWYVYVPDSSLEANNDTIVSPNVGAGRWIKNRSTVNASDVGDLVENIDDRVASLLIAGNNITLSYNDTNNQLTINSIASGYVAEQARDDIGAILTDTDTIDLIYNDINDTITGNIISGSITNNHISASAAISQSKILNLAASFLAKADAIHNHTATDISNFTEAAQDSIASLLVAGSNVSLDYNDVSNTLTISASVTGGGGLAGWDDLYSSSTSDWDSEY